MQRGGWLLLVSAVACSSSGGSGADNSHTSGGSANTTGGGSANTSGGSTNTRGGSSNTAAGSSNTGASTNDASTGEASSSGGSATGDTAGDSCDEIFTCVQQCADDPCANACYARGSAAGKQKIDALAACLSANDCSDATCAQTYCSQEVDACDNDVNGSSDAGAPVTQGNIDPSLVGAWMSSSISYHFSADGSYLMVGVLSSPGPCIAFDHIDISNEGVAETNGNMLTTTATTSKQVTTDCAGIQTTKTSPGDTQQFTWSISGSTLTMVGDTGSIDYQKQ